MKTPSDILPSTVATEIGIHEIEYRRKFSALAFDIAKAVENYLNKKSKLLEADFVAIYCTETQVPQETASAVKEVHGEPLTRPKRNRSHDNRDNINFDQ